jgi:predicted dehydrogenase
MYIDLGLSAQGLMMTAKKRYALVGTGGRAGMYIDALTTTYHEVGELVAFCDLSQTCMDWYNQQLRTDLNLVERPTYLAADFDRMVSATKPDVVIVTTMGG